MTALRAVSARSSSLLGWALSGVTVLVAGLMLSGCAQSKEQTMTPHEARDALVSTITDSAALLNITGWKPDGPGVQRCGDGSSANYTYVYGAGSTGRRNSAFSRLSRLISTAASVVTPGRSPASTCCRRIHVRIVSGEPMPSIPATAVIAAYSLG